MVSLYFMFPFVHVSLPSTTNEEVMGRAGTETLEDIVTTYKEKENGWPRPPTAHRKTSQFMGDRKPQNKEGRPKKTWRSIFKEIWKRWIRLAWNSRDRQ